MKTSNLKFLSMAAISAMIAFTSCDEDDPTDNPNTDGTENPDGEATGYSSELFQAEANHNTINFDFSNTFSNLFVGTIDGGADMPSVNSFFTAAAYQGCLSRQQLDSRMDTDNRRRR